MRHHALAVVVVAGSTSAQAAILAPSVRAVQGQVVNGQVLQNVQTPVITSTGTVAFVSQAATQYLPFAGGPFTSFSSTRSYASPSDQQVLGSPMILVADDGTLASGGASGTSQNVVDVYMGQPNSLYRIAQTSSTVPDYPAAQFRGAGGFGLTFPTMSNSGRVVFSGRTTGGPEYGLWYSDARAVGAPAPHVMFASGQPAPGIPGSPTIVEVGERASVNSSGTVALRAWTQGASVSTVFVGQPGSLTAAVRIGDTVSGRTVAGAYQERLNNAGTLVYNATFTVPTGPVGIIRQSGSARELIAASGDQAPGMVLGESFSSASAQHEIGPGIISGAGEVVFEGRIRHGASEDIGIWSYRSQSDYINIIRSGTPLSQVGEAD